MFLCLKTTHPGGTRKFTMRAFREFREFCVRIFVQLILLIFTDFSCLTQNTQKSQNGASLRPRLSASPSVSFFDKRRLVQASKSQ